MRERVLLVMAIGVLLAAVANAVEVRVEKDRITGRVFDSSTGSGIAALSVRLAAPKVAKQPVRVSVTNADGEFAFQGLRIGKYMLTIYRGTTLLYRKEIDNSVTDTFTVPLRSEAPAH